MLARLLFKGQQTLRCNLDAPLNYRTSIDDFHQNAHTVRPVASWSGPDAEMGWITITLDIGAPRAFRRRTRRSGLLLAMALEVR